MLMFTARRTRSVSRQRTRVLNRELAHQPCIESPSSTSAHELSVLNRELAHQPCIESPRADSFSISALCQRTRVLNRELCIESPSSRAHVNELVF